MKEKLLSELKSQLKSKKALEALERVDTAITFFEKENTPFNVASIGRYCVEEWEGPKVQSIRNNVLLSKFIKDRFKIFKTTNKNTGNSKNTAEEQFEIDNIEDEKTKSYLRIQKEKYKILEEKYLSLKKLVNDIQPVNVEKLISDNLDINNPIDLIDIETDVSDNHSNNHSRTLLNTIDNQDNIIHRTVAQEEDIKELISTLNTTFLNNIDIQLSVRGKFVINDNTGSLIYEIRS